MAQSMTPAAVAKVTDDKIAEAMEGRDAYRDEMHALLDGALGLLRHLVAVTPGAGHAQEQVVAGLWDRLASLKAAAKPPVE